MNMTQIQVISRGVALALLAFAGTHVAQAEPGTSKNSTGTASAKVAAPQPASNSAKTPMTEAEQQVLLDMHKLNQSETAVGKLAATHAAKTDVKQFAQHLISDHKANDEKVMSLAKRRGVALSALTPTPKQAEKDKNHEQLKQRLETLKGQDFDREFTQAMIEGHRNAISDAQNALAQCRDSDMRALLEETLPKLNKHLQASERLSQNERPAP